jgi:hypothetical protein
MARTEFVDQLKIIKDVLLVNGFNVSNLALQMMNEFPKWSESELELVSRESGFPIKQLLKMYHGLYRVVRERRIDEQKVTRNGRNHGVSFIQEVVGQSYEPPKNKSPFGQSYGQWGDSTGTSGPSPVEEMLRQYGARFRPDSAAGKSFDTRRPWSAAPALLHAHFEKLDMAFPISYTDAKKQYHKRAMETHPDKNQEKKTAAADFQAVKNAWDRIRPFIEAQEKKT